MRCIARLFAITFFVILNFAFFPNNSTQALKGNGQGQNPAGAVGCVPAPGGMVSWWAGEGNANDIRGENNGTLQNGVTFPLGEVGQAFGLNRSSSQYVSVADSPSLRPTNITIDGWFNFASNPGDQHLVTKAAGTGPFDSYVLYFAGGVLRAGIGDATGVDSVVSSFSPTLNTWYHIAFTFDDSTNTETLYVNGAVVQSGTTNRSIGYDTHAVLIGAESENEVITLFYDGQIDEVEVFNRAVSQTEIQSIFNAGSAGKCKPRCTQPPQSGMVSWWDADDNPFDRQGTNHGTMPPAGAGFGTGKVGRAFTFDGSQNPVSVPDNASLDPQALTIDAWVFPTTLDGAEDIIINKEVVGTVQYEMGIKGILSPGAIPFGNLTVFIGGIGGLPNDDGGWVNGGGPLPLNTWSHVAMTFDGSTLNAFINGVLTRQVMGLSGTVPNSNGPFRIGARNPNVAFQTDPFNGSIDEVEVFNRALLPSEIQAINNAGFAGKCKLCLAPPPNMVGWWNGDANTRDDSGNGNNGTLQGGTAFAIGRVGQSFSFDGVDDFVSIANNPTLDIGTGNITIDLWVNFNSLASDQTLFHKVSGTGGSANDPSYFVEFDLPNSLRFRIGEGLSASNDLIVPTSLQTGVWYHIAAVRTGDTNTLYLNGSLLGSQTAGNNIDTGTGGNAAIGKCVSSGSCVRFVNGQIDELEVFNRALTQVEIQSLVAAGTSGKCKIANTSTGPNQSNQVGDATVTFTNVLSGGNTTYQTLPLYQPGPMPFGFNSPLHVAHISTTATFNGGVKVCFNLQAISDNNTFNQLRVLHQEGNDLINRTSSSNFPTRTLCATAASLSPFVITQGPNLPTAAPANISGQVISADGSPLAGVTVTMSGARSARTITDSNGSYRFNNVDTDKFYTVTPSLVSYQFSPTERSFSLIGNKTDAVFTGMPNVLGGGDAIDSPDYFVRQHYLDFLGREPDEAGFNFWTDQIGSCGTDASCVEVKRINVSAAYFLSIEFQRTGGFVDGLYRTSYGRRPLFAEFMPDTAHLAQNVVVGKSGWEQQLAANKQAFVADWVERSIFKDAYNNLSNGAYVDGLISHTKVSFTQSEHDELVNGLADNTLTRSAVLLRIAEDERFVSAKRNEAFVMMEYFGYLRRDPDENGYEFWLNKLNQFDGNFERAEMVKAFLVSSEYRERFPR